MGRLVDNMGSWEAPAHCRTSGLGAVGWSVVLLNNEGRVGLLEGLHEWEDVLVVRYRVDLAPGLILY